MSSRGDQKGFLIPSRAQAKICRGSSARRSCERRCCAEAWIHFHRSRGRGPIRSKSGSARVNSASGSRSVSEVSYRVEVIFLEDRSEQLRRVGECLEDALDGLRSVCNEHVQNNGFVAARDRICTLHHEQSPNQMVTTSMCPSCDRERAGQY